MTWASGLPLLFLAVSSINATGQLVQLHRLRAWGAKAAGRDHDVHRGLVRTTACRVAAALIYIGFGITALLVRDPVRVAALSLIVFTFVQLVWQANSVADLRLRRKLAEAAVPYNETRR